jgi:hypothetical protein
MIIDTFLSSMYEALRACDHPRFFETERGFQGQLLIELKKRFDLPDQAILEQEYQKCLNLHGLNIRPDIIIHEPYNPLRHASRSSGNIAVIELKLNASTKQASLDIENIEKMLEILQYPIGVFVNIGSINTYSELVPSKLKGRIILYAVSLQAGKVNVVEKRI